MGVEVFSRVEHVERVEVESWEVGGWEVGGWEVGGVRGRALLSTTSLPKPN